MTNSFRALCAELADAYLRTLEHINNSTWLGYEPSDDPLLQRARASLADEPAVPAPPADGEVAELVAWLRSTGEGQPCLSDEGYARLTRAAELLERQVVVPVAVSVRLPGPEDCDAEGRCWWFCPTSVLPNGMLPYWCLGPADPPKSWFTHWLPAHALPLPEVGS